ncbi:hypothetical protein [Kitasatospora sp. GAS204B]|uniref:hypothetical protein n=1 Tax=unclassified Kitasatospora TaxID=2633591 RepID=UPI002476E830|nr:hypothetical protein [Kitasatospora sp. GAS204B]MDH6118908.1 hypothetical protein [Kitasatospora sp. GAS204B]
MPGTLRFVLFGLIALFGIGLSAAPAVAAPAAPAPVTTAADTAPGLVCGACWS